MSALAARQPWALSQDDVLDEIAANAAAADAGQRTLAPDMALLCEAGLLARLASPTVPPREQATLLRRIARASLSVGRLAEGHMNALRLVALYGTGDQQRRHMAAADAGAIFGVWGADGPVPVGVAEYRAGRISLCGGKRFASGLGTVSRAVVTAATAEGTVLAAADVDGGPRADFAAWDTTGMRATASGTYDFDGVEAEVLGKPGDYEREPFFEGGVWRYAALHVGGLEALGEAVRAGVAAFGEAATEAQLHRVAHIASLAHAARLMVEDAAEKVERPGAGAAAVALSLAAREMVEEACLSGIAIADRALGARSFATGETVERVRRDLTFFLRQANLDGKLRQVGGTLCRMEPPVGELWDAP